jgi:hypothetical protein
VGVGEGQNPVLVLRTAPVGMVWATPSRRRLTACWVVGIIGVWKLDLVPRGVGDIEGAVELTPLAI